MSSGRRALVVATYQYADSGLSRLTSPEHDAEAFAAVLHDPEIAGFDVTTLVNQPHHVVGEAIADFYGDCRRDDLTLLYFSGHGLKDDEGRLHLAMTNTRRQALMFTAISAAQLNEAMDACPSRRKVLILDCCYSGAFPVGRTAKADEGMHTLERFQGRGRAVLTASDATQYAFEGDAASGAAVTSVFTKHLVAAIRSGAADTDQDGDIALDELYAYVRERVVAEMPQQRPKKQEDVDGRILIARNVNWTLPLHLQHALDSPIADQRRTAIAGLAHLYQVGNILVRATVAARLQALMDDDSRAVSGAASAALEQLGISAAGPPVAPATGPIPALVAAPAPRAVPSVEVSPRNESAPRAVVARPPPRFPPPVRVPPPVKVPPRVKIAAPVTVVPTEPKPSPTVPEQPGGDVPDSPSHEVVHAPRTHRAPALGIVALVVLGAVPLTLSRLLTFEAVNGHTAQELADNLVPWLLFIVLPLAAGTLLLSLCAGSTHPAVAAVGLLSGGALTLTELVLFYSAFFVDLGTSHAPGPAFWMMAIGGVLVLVAAFMALARPPIAGPVAFRRDPWLFAAAVVLACLVVSVVSRPDSSGIADWLQSNSNALVVAPIALCLTVLRLSSPQRIAGLVAVASFTLWTVYFPLRQLDSGSDAREPSEWLLEIVCAVGVLAACAATQWAPHQDPEDARR